MAHKNKQEPNTAPPPDRWFNLTLGSSFQDNSPSKFCTLRYEFKPASIDKTQTGSLHKTKENRVTVEFQNNQPGKPKLSFEGSSEDYKDNDAVLFFDGESFRLERLHRAVKRLRHVRLPGESAAAGIMGGGASAGQGMDAPSPPRGKGSKGQSSVKAVVNSVPVEMERIDIGEPKSPGPRSTGKGVANNNNNTPDPPFTSTESTDIDPKSHDIEEHLRELFEGVESEGSPDKIDIDDQEGNTTGFDFALGLVGGENQNNDMDDEIADVDLSDEETGNGPNAAEALRAQVNATEAASSSSSSSGSGSSGSGSGSGSGSSSSSDSEASDDDSVNSI